MTAPATWRDRRVRTVLIIAGLMTLAYAVQVIVDIARPKREYLSHSTIGILGSSLPDGVPATFWCYVVCLSTAVVVAVACAVSVGRTPDVVHRARRARIGQAAVAALLLVPFTMYPAFLLKDHVDTLLVCVPTTVYALWVLTCVQRYARLPARLLLAAFGWGALVATGFGGSMNIWLSDYYLNYAGVGTNSLKVMHQMSNWISLSAGVSEELGKGAGVAIIYILGRRHLHNVVSGIVVGAAVGLGFNIVESVEYMSSAGGLASTMQYFFRQSVGLFGAHLAFTAAIGAAFGIARQLPDARRRRLIVASGFVVAIAAHFANDVFLRFFGGVKHNWFAPSPTLDMLAVQPLVMLTLQGPFVLLYVLLLRTGLREQRAALAVELPAEVERGSGAVVAPEVDVLLQPARRFYLKVQALRRYGLMGYLTLGRLFTAQLDLGMLRWHESRGDTDPYGPSAVDAQIEVIRRRFELASLDRLVGRPSGVPA